MPGCMLVLRPKERAMIKFNVLYPGTTGARFDHHHNRENTV